MEWPRGGFHLREFTRERMKKCTFVFTLFFIATNTNFPFLLTMDSFIEVGFEDSKSSSLVVNLVVSLF